MSDDGVSGGAGPSDEASRATDASDDVDRLLVVLEELRVLLADHGEARWAAWVERAARSIRAGDARGIDHLLAAYGGMGSLTDVYFHPRNGNATSEEEGHLLNDRMRDLTGQARRLADELRRG